MFSSGVNLGGGGNAGGTGWQVTGNTVVNSPVISGNNVTFQNPTLATIGVQQNSTSITWSGNGFATTPVQSQNVSFRAQVLPVQGASNPTGAWVLSSSVNGAGYADVLSVSPQIFSYTGATPFYIDSSNIFGNISGVGGAYTFQIANSTYFSLNSTRAVISSPLVVGGVGATITAGSVLVDFQSTSAGVLMPRMTLTALNAMASPVDGMIVYESTTKSMKFRIDGSWSAYNYLFPSGGSPPVQIEKVTGASVKNVSKSLYEESAVTLSLATYNVWTNPTTNSTITIRWTYTGVQSNTTKGASGFSYVGSTTFRSTAAGTLVKIGTTTYHHVVNDTTFTFTTVPDFIASSGSVNFTRQLSNTAQTWQTFMTMEFIITP